MPSFRCLLALVAFMAVAFRTSVASKIEADSDNTEVMQAVISAAAENNRPLDAELCTISGARFGVGCYIILNECEYQFSHDWIVGACLTTKGRFTGPCATATHDRREDAVKGAKEALAKKLLGKGKCGFNTTHTVADTE